MEVFDDVYNEYLVEQVFEKGYIYQEDISGIKDYIFDGQQDVRCCFCGCLLTRQTATIEHIIPRSYVKFSNRNQVNNLTLSCNKCNGERIISDFDEYRMYVQRKTTEPPIGCKDYQNNKRQQLINKIDGEIVFEMYSCKANVAEIAKYYNVSGSIIRQVLREYLRAKE